MESPVEWLKYVFTLHLKARDHTRFNFNFLRYDHRMSFKSPHNFLVTALGHSVKWPLVSALKVKDGSGSAAIAHKPEDCV